MNSEENKRDQSFNLDGLRSVLFTAAKLRWEIGMAIGYLAVLIVPITIYFDFKEIWLGAIIATVLSIIGKLLRWCPIRFAATQICFTEPMNYAQVSDIQLIVL